MPRSSAAPLRAGRAERPGVRPLHQPAGRSRAGRGRSAGPWTLVLAGRRAHDDGVDDVRPDPAMVGVRSAPLPGGGRLRVRPVEPGDAGGLEALYATLS